MATVHSNAFNFLSFVQSGVDPRTGQYTCAVSLPELKANRLCGPIVPLTLGFNPMNTGNYGFGTGWGLQLSHFDPASRILSLSTGETYRIEGTSSRPTVPERKIDSFHFSFESATDSYRVVHKSGLVEILKVKPGDTVAWVSEIHSNEGHRVSLLYEQVNGALALKTISDDYGQLLAIDRTDRTRVQVDLHPGKGLGNGPLASFVLGLNSDQVQFIRLPTPEQASWRFVYKAINGYLCITELETPVGAHEIVTYASQGHQFPNNANPSLPKVESYEQRPGFGQPAIQMRYSYSSENFLGFNASGLIWDDDGLDNLYRAASSYTYTSSEMLYAGETLVRSTARTFNNFHLLTEETVTQRDNVLTTRTTYHGIPGLPFERQPPQCQLPDNVLKLWYLKSASSQTHEEFTRTTFDDFGNLLTQHNPDGTVEKNTYYPAAGAEGCPPDPQGFVRTLRDKTVIPAVSTRGDAPILRNRYRYALQTGVGGTAPDWLGLGEEALLHLLSEDQDEAAATTLQTTTFSYINQPADRYLHGRKLQEILTLNGQSSITDYAYQTAIARAGETVQHTVVSLSTRFDQVKKSFTLQHSLLNGEPLLNRDDNDVEISYSYDVLGRVVTETVAPGTPYEASRNYEYVLSSRLGQQAEQVAIDVKGVKTRTLLDGLNRVVEEQRQDADAKNGGKQAGEYRQTYTAAYNALGQLIKEIEFDWFQDEDLPLNSTYQYDDWGEQSSETGPDGVVQHSVTDPIKLTVTQWHEGMGKTITVNNLFGKPVSIERLGLDSKRISLETNAYDGLGRTAEQVDALGNARTFIYDAFDRMISNQLPGGAVVERAYAPHSSKDLPILIKVDGVVLGEQAFDGLDRMIASTVGGRVSTFEFDAGQLQPAKVHTPGGQDIDYLYQPQLGEQPIQRKTLSSTADYTYDLQNARLLSSKEKDQELQRDYFSNGELKEERRVQGGETYAMQYQYSLKGLLLEYTDVFGATQRYAYDDSARLENTTVGTLVSRFAYNALGQTESIETTDSATAQTLKISLEYDDIGREVLRRFALPGGVEQTLGQAYDAADHLQQRTLSEGGAVLRDETFSYDLRGRLQDYTASGPQAPVDAQGKQIQSQAFSFDVLDNIIEVKTTFIGGSNSAVYRYEGLDPAQLSAVRNSHPDYPVSIELSYDEDGNMISDELGRTLEYDALGRLVSVSVAGGAGDIAYGYDAQDSLTGTLSDQGAEQRFYNDGELASQVQGSQQRTFVRGAGVLMAEQQLTAGGSVQLLATDSKKTVLVEINSTSANHAEYTAYGDQPATATISSLSGFNGELRESATGWYLLGQGYRAYNPSLMRFHSPDSLSPFDEGGLNAYAYCVGDPVNYMDPDGHMPSWLNLVIGIGGGILLGVITTGIATPLVAGAIAAGTVSAGTVSAATTVATVTAGVLTLGSLGTGAIALAQGEEEGQTLSNISMGLGLAAGLAGGFAAGFARGVSRAAKVAKVAKVATKGLRRSSSDLPRNLGDRRNAIPTLSGNSRNHVARFFNAKEAAKDAVNVSTKSTRANYVEKMRRPENMRNSPGVDRIFGNPRRVRQGPYED